MIARAILEGTRFEPRRAHLATLKPNVDQVMVTYFEAPHSYTTEDLIEISCHGSPVVLRHCVTEAIAAGARLAEPGEFTLRAYVHGRLDLPQAEAVRDLIDSTTLYQAKIATQQVEGSVSRRLTPLKTQLLEMIALLEAGIDFAEDDIDVAPQTELLIRLDPILYGVRQMAESFAYGNLVRSGMTLAIVGLPNVGKSSLFNRLLDQERSIVTDIPGTTRDLVSESANIRGIPVKLMDTAGIRESLDLVESLGIERSREAMADADLTVVVVDGSKALSPQDRELMRGRYILAANKADLGLRVAEGIAVSAKTGQGIDELRDAILPAAETARETGFITSVRQAKLLEEAVTALERAREAIVEDIPHEMVLLDLYNVLRPIDGVTGATTADDILNRIFSTFCIGK